MEVNGELSASFSMKGGVKQGCPLSPYLFICVLETMAISIRQDNVLEGIEEPISKKRDKVSCFADDSSLLVSKLEKQVPRARMVMENYERATGGKVHDGKTKIMKLVRQNATSQAIRSEL